MKPTSRLLFVLPLGIALFGHAAHASTDGATRLELLGAQGDRALFLLTTESECGSDCNRLFSARVRGTGPLKLEPVSTEGKPGGLEGETARLRAALGKPAVVEQAQYRARAAVRGTVLEEVRSPLYDVAGGGTPMLPVHDLQLELTWGGRTLTHRLQAREAKLFMRGVWTLPGPRKDACVVAIVGAAPAQAASLYPVDGAFAVCR